MCFIPQKKFSKILLGQVWRVIPIHDWLELVLVNCPTTILKMGIIPIKLIFNFLGYFSFYDIGCFRNYEFKRDFT